MASSIIPFPGPLKSSKGATRLPLAASSAPRKAVTFPGRHRGLHLIKSARGVVVGLRPATAAEKNLSDSMKRARKIVEQVEREREFQAMHQASRFFAIREAHIPAFMPRPETPLTVLHRALQTMRSGFRLA